MAYGTQQNVSLFSSPGPQPEAVQTVTGFSEQFLEAN